MSKNKTEKKKKARYTSIGGQAVMEGVMMRGATSMAVSVRDSHGCIRTESNRIKPTKQKNLFFRLPVVRGVVNFLSMMVVGVQILMKSADVYAEDEFPPQAKPDKKSKKEKPEKKKKEDSNATMTVAMTFSVVLGLGLAIGLFFVLPTLVVQQLFGKVFHWHFNPIVTNLIEGAVRFAIFLGYLLSVSLMKDIRRVFMYHGAEHRVINCYESGMDMTVENVQKCTTVHNRCGTTFIFFVMLMSIIVYALFDGLMRQFGVEINNIFLKLAAKIGLLPVVAGLSYELLKGLAKTECWVFFPLKAPGLLLQKITTKPPEDAMVEVSLTAFQTVLAMDADPSIQPQAFGKPEKTRDLYDRQQARLARAEIDDASVLDWIFCHVNGCKRNEIFQDEFTPVGRLERIKELVAEVAAGKPVQYALGETEFYGYPIEVNEHVLIPRFDTELLAEQAVLTAAGRKTCLDLCTGSGAIAVVLAKKTELAVTASDISESALEVAARNAEKNGATVEFVCGDLFQPFGGRVFDMIVSNPPYIPSNDLAELEPVVRDYEPHSALDGGADGLDFYRRIAEDATKHLSENGVLLLEVGINQAESVAALFADDEVSVMKDWNGIERILKVTRKEERKQPV